SPTPCCRSRSSGTSTAASPRPWPPGKPTSARAALSGRALIRKALRRGGGRRIRRREGLAEAERLRVRPVTAQRLQTCDRLADRGPLTARHPPQHQVRLAHALE